MLPSALLSHINALFLLLGLLLLSTILTISCVEQCPMEAQQWLLSMCTNVGEVFADHLDLLVLVKLRECTNDSNGIVSRRKQTAACVMSLMASLTRPP